MRRETGAFLCRKKYLTYRNYRPYNRQENMIGKDCDGDSKLILNVSGI